MKNDPSRLFGPFRLTGAVFLCCLCFASLCSAQPARTHRPRVGLALGGGGARGAAHIGVLRVLEDLRIPVDFIAGTSMGSIIGGLYASGLSTKELELAMTGIDWGDAFRDEPPREDFNFRRKQQDYDFMIKARAGVKKSGLLLPAGAIQGQKLNLILKRLALPTASVNDFDDLPIPYRAVATDIETGEVVVLGTGNLANAMRASMSVPAVFAPVRIDGRLLVDGGVVDNVPVDVVRQMGADVVIAVNVGTPLMPGDEIKSLLDITAQLTNMMTNANTAVQLRSLDPTDVLIRPDLGDIGSADFERAAEGIKTGVKAAEAVAEKLRTLSLSPEDYRAHLSERRQLNKEPITVDFIRIVNDSRLSDEAIRDRIHAKLGEKLDTEAMEKDIGRVYGLDLFEQVGYDVVQESDNKTGVVVDAKKKSWGPDYLQFGLKLADNFDGENSYTVGAALTMTELNRLGGEWRTEVEFGDTTRVFSEFYQPLTYVNRYFLDPFVEYRKENINLFDSEDIIAEYQLEGVQFGLAAGRELGTWGEARIGVLRGMGDADLYVGDPDVREEGDFDSAEVFARLAYDKLDNVNFPEHGARSALRWSRSLEELGADSSFDTLAFDWLWANTRGKNTFIAGLNLATSFDSDLPIQNAFSLGGLFRLSGLSEDQIYGDYRGLGRIMYMRKISDISFLPAYLGGSLEAGNVWNDADDIDFDSLIPAGSVFLGLNSPIGPAYLAYGLAEGGQNSFYFYIGFPY